MARPDDELVTAVMSASRALVGIAAASIEQAHADVTLIQYRALVVLSLHGPLLMSELARSVRLSPSSTTRLVERLERKDLVVRKQSPTSRRSTNVVISAQGQGLVDEVMAAREREIRRVLTNLPRTRHAPLREAFEAFAEAAGEPPSASGGLPSIEHAGGAVAR